MEKAVYDFYFKIKYRRLDPLRYNALLIAAILLFINMGLPAAGMIFIHIFMDSSILFDSLLVLIAAGMFVIPTAFFIFSVCLYRSEVNNHYIFYDNRFKVISKKDEAYVNYSDIIKMIIRDNILLLFISERRCYILPFDPTETNNNGFESFIAEKTGIIPTMAVTSKKRRRKEKKP